MQHLSGLPKRLRLSPKDNPVFRAQVRFFAWIELKHMLHCLCGPPSIPLSFNLAIVLPRWDTYCVSLGTDPYGPTPSIHRLRRGLPGYLILFDPHAFVHERQFRARQQPSQPVFFQISKISPLHLEFRYPLPNSRLSVSEAVLQLSCRISPPT